MCQEKIIKILKKNNEWMTAKEIAKLMSISPGTISSRLSKMLKYGEVLRMEENGRSRGFKKHFWRAR